MCIRDRTVTGTVKRVYKERVGDFTLVTFLLADGTNYLVSTEVEPLVVYLEVNDTVNVTYLNTGEMFLPVKKITISGL